MIKTPICEILGIEYPVIQGGMAWIADANLAAAVSNAGGLGIISAMNADGQWLRNEIKKAKKLTNKPFGVNIMLMSPHVNEVAKIVIEEKVHVVTTGAGNPSKYIKSWKEAGIKVVPVVPSTAIAKLVTRAGADAVIAEGGESGGHVGDLTTMTLVPQVCDVVDIPVVAAGGIADGRGMAAAFMLGACGIQMGTRFLVANECNVSNECKQKIIKAKDIDTMVTGKRLGHPVRVLKNPFAREFYKMEYNSNITDEEIEAFGSGSLRKAAVERDTKNGSFMSGQIAAIVKKEESAEAIIKDVCAHAEQILAGGMKWVK